MEKEYLFISQAQRFDILKAISEGFCTASSIAEKLSLSITYVAQQLKLLEAHNIISVTKKKAKKVGKPALHYCIQKQSTALCHIGPEQVFFHSLKTTKSDQYLIQAAHYEQHHLNYFLFKLFFQHEALFHIAEHVGVWEAGKNKTHLFIITKDVDTIRKKYSTIVVEDMEGHKMEFSLWSHTEEEIRAGLEKKEEYFMNKVQNSRTLIDRTNTLTKLKKIASSEEH